MDISVFGFYARHRWPMGYGLWAMEDLKYAHKIIHEDAYAYYYLWLLWLKAY